MRADCVVHFGNLHSLLVREGEQRIRLALPLPVLAGRASECWSIDDASFEQAGSLLGFRGKGLLFGCALLPAVFPLANQVYGLYRELLAWVKPLRLYRVWNFVPTINKECQGLENYQSFCQGRSLAFEHHFGSNFETSLCSASAVGLEDPYFALYFLAGEAPPVHVENPRQVAAFHYPSCYGPRSPSFARGTTVPGRCLGFISGTASIRGHQTEHQGDLLAQLSLTLENLNLVKDQLRLHQCEGEASRGETHCKIYLRQAEQAAVLLAALEGLDPEHTFSLCKVRWSMLKADICRADLDVEIEASFLPVSGIQTLSPE
jgi:hypothetical protein